MKRGGTLALIAGLSVVSGVLLAIADVGPDAVVIATAGVVCVVPILIAIRRRHLDVFEPAYLFALSFGILFFIRPILEWSSTRGVPTMAGLDPTPTYLAAVAVATLGGIAFYVGYYGPFAIGIAAKLPRAAAQLDGPRVRVGVLGVTAVGIGLYAAFLMLSGGAGAVAAVIAGRNPDYAAIVSQPAGYLYSGLLFLFPAGLMLLISAASWRSFTALVGLILISMSVVTAVFSGSRSAIAPVALTLMLLWYLRRRARPRLTTIAALAMVGFVLVISVPRDFRSTNERTGTLIDYVASSISNAEATGREFFLGLDTAMLPAFAIELSYVPDVIPFQFGSTYLEAATRPIPRALWSSKPEAADTNLMQVLWPDLADQRIGFAFSFFGEPFLNFGLPGVVIIASLFGVAWRILWEYWRQQRNNLVAIGIYAISWPFLFVFMRGGIGVDYQRLVVALGPFLALAWFGARRRGVGNVALSHADAFGRIRGRVLSATGQKPTLPARANREPR